MRGPKVLASAIDTATGSNRTPVSNALVGLDELEVLGDDEDEAEQGEESGGDGEAAAGEPAVCEH